MGIMKIQPTEENPHIVNNYPYGRLKCICKFWVESVKNKGDRWVKQTQNPKTDVWNKPKKSTYSAVMVAYIDDKGHATYKSSYMNTDLEKYKEFMEFVDDLVLNDLQLSQLRLIRAYIKAYEGVSFVINSKPIRTEEEEKKHDEEQKDIQKNILKRVAYNYNKDEGVL